MSLIFLIDKPLGWTSFYVVNIIRWKIKHFFKIEKVKVGHAGTLDPQAVGILIICIGVATKKINLYQKKEKKFIGDIYQIPPIFSALKKNGEKLYKLARKVKFVKIHNRKVKIHNFEITDINLPFLNFRISCGKGVYIRKLAKDFGSLLKSKSYLCSLRRKRIGELSVYDAYILEEYYQNKNLPFLFNPYF